MKLSALRLGLASGAVLGLGIFLLTLIAVWQGQDYLLFDIIAIYPGYEVTLSGALMGFLWGFFDGFLGGYLLAWIYNGLGFLGLCGSCRGKKKCDTGKHCDECCVKCCCKGGDLNQCNPESDKSGSCC